MMANVMSDQTSKNQEILFSLTKVKLVAGRHGIQSLVLHSSAWARFDRVHFKFGLGLG
jgi:hypothetical protein